MAHEEEDIITLEERQASIHPKKINEVMKNVVVYVEYRAGADNRTDGIKNVISEMGITVNDKLLRYIFLNIHKLRSIFFNYFIFLVFVFHIFNCFFSPIN